LWPESFSVFFIIKYLSIVTGFRGEEFKKSANQKEESPVVAMFVNGSGWNEH
jgi:hypothetical protein